MTAIAIGNSTQSVSRAACSGPVDARGAVRPECRVCGRCDDIRAIDAAVAASALARRQAGASATA